MNRKLLAVIGLVLALGAALSWFLWIRGGDGASKPRAGTGVGSGATSTLPRPGAGGGSDGDPAAASGRQAGGWDVDPVGALPLEGQVLDDQDQPVAGAEVVLASTPRRTTTSEDDGTFVFDKLVSRTYALSARAGDLVGGPVMHRLSGKSGPAVLRLRRGATLEVTVLDERKAPVVGAQLELRDAVVQTASTDATGRASFRGVSPGWAQVVARAAGYAPAFAGTPISTSAASASLTLVVHKGAAVSGRVVDESGAPVVGAKVMVEAVGRGWQLGDLDRDSQTTSAQGEFTFPAVAAGTHRFVAQHPELAPGASSPQTVDGTTPLRGVEIKLGAGGTISGVVVGTDQAPVANATVRLAPRQDEGGSMYGWGRGGRQIVCDEAGAFTIRGLARAGYRLQAESDQASSKLVDADLTSTDKVTDLRLVLDVTGEIAGIVVDSAGEPVAEASVTALPDFWAGGDLDRASVGGFSTDTTDGGGQFRIRGLADGAYRVWAYRGTGGNWWGQKGTPAKVGDTTLRIVLPAPGKLVGKIAIDPDGRAPALASASIGWEAPAPVVGGEFELSELAPGSYDLTLRGPEFPELVRRDLKVTSGKTTNLGTIRVKPGRRVVGKVVDGRGNPVAGARIQLGKFLVSDGAATGQDQDAVTEMMGIRVASSGADGGFVLVGVSEQAAKLVAEHPDAGRSLSVDIPAGATAPPELTVTLRGFGAIAGKVTRKGQPVGGGFVSASPRGAESKLVFVQTGADGSYVVEKVPEGPTRLTAGGAAGGGTGMGAVGTVDVEVVAGQRVSADIALPVGDLSLEVTVKARPGERIDAAQVFVLRGQAAVKTGKDLMDAFTQGSGQISGMAFAMGPKPAAFAELLPGQVSICTIPITGDMSDPQFSARLQRHTDTLAVHCALRDLPASPKAQTFVHEVPQMAPLPAD